MSNKPKPHSNFFNDFMLGGTSGAIAKTVSAPIERVKLLLQTQDSNFQLANKKYRGINDCFVRIYREEGMAAYWKGNWTNVIRYFPTTAFNFAFKDYFLRTFQRYDPSKQPKMFLVGNLLAGGSAGMCCTMIVYPLDFARTRLGVDVGKTGEVQFKSLSHCFMDIYKKNGIRGLYQGLGMSLLSVFTYRGMYFGFFDTGKRLVEDYNTKPLWYKFAFAQLITTTSETINYPTDTIRRRMMMNSGLEVKIYTDSFHCIKTIYRNEGIKAFYKGNLTNMVRSTSSSLVLVLYDEFQTHFMKLR